MQITPPTYKIQNTIFHPVARVIGDGIEQQAIDRKITSQYILAWIQRKLHRIRPAPIAVSAIMPKRSNLRHHAIVGRAMDHQHDSKI